MNLSNHLFLLLFLSIITISLSNVSPGTTLQASSNQTWPSPNNTFSLGFTQVGPNSYVASIFYIGGVPIIWTAGEVDSGGSFQFLSNGNLQLKNSSGFIVWTSNTTSLGVTSASLDDSGNLSLLRNGTFSVWSTFLNPTDTLVPSQYFTENLTLRSGSYSFRFINSSNLTLLYSDGTAYWNKDLTPVESQLSRPFSLGLLSNGILSVFDANLTSSAPVAYSNDYGEGSDVLRYLKLDSDGNFRMYSTNRGSGTKTVTWTVLADQCQVYGYCGNLGICTYKETNPTCDCPSKNFEFVDLSDPRKGCKREVELDACTGNVTILQLEDTKFLTFQDDQVVIVGLTSCQYTCLSSESCVAASSLSDGTGKCYVKNTPDFVSGFQGPTVLSTSYVKVCGPVEPNPLKSAVDGGDKNCNRWKDRGFVTVFVAAICVGFVGLAGGFWWCKTRQKLGGIGAQYTLLDYSSGAPIQFSYRELQLSTRGFNEKLGAGGFGAVYKGTLGDRTVVAVKKLEGIEQGEKQFRIEVCTISCTHHLNLVRLMGFCSEGKHRLLVYEFMKNGSLDKFLFGVDEQLGRHLNWERRFKMAIGTAKGITYLHEECRDCIVHCDIKPENILLDENFQAKVSDFGLAKLINRKDHRYRSWKSIRGTRGYLAPEWLANLPLTSKSDVYSYGMVLLEIVSGRRNFELTNGRKFSNWANEEFEKGNVEGLLDKRMADQELNMEQVIRAIQVSFWCVQEHPSQRPSMGKVVQMLEGVIDVQKPPALDSISKEEPSINISCNGSSMGSVDSTPEASPEDPSFSSALKTIELQDSIASPVNMERPSSSLLGSY